MFPEENISAKNRARIQKREKKLNKRKTSEQSKKEFRPIVNLSYDIPDDEFPYLSEEDKIRLADLIGKNLKIESDFPHNGCSGTRIQFSEKDKDPFCIASGLVEVNFPESDLSDDYFSIHVEDADEFAKQTHVRGFRNLIQEIFPDSADTENVMIEDIYLIRCKETFLHTDLPSAEIEYDNGLVLKIRGKYIEIVSDTFFLEVDIGKEPGDEKKTEHVFEKDKGKKESERMNRLFHSRSVIPLCNLLSEMKRHRNQENNISKNQMFHK